MEQPILPLRDAPVLADAAAVWFSRRWGTGAFRRRHCSMLSR